MAGATLEGRRILVTGASGFVGRRLCDHLKRMGAAAIRWARRDASDVADGRGGGVDLSDAATVRRASRATGLVDFVVHLASGGRLLCEPDIAGEVAMWRHLLDAYGLSASRLLFMGSADQYGGVPAPQAETDPCRGASPYARAKIECDRLSEQWRSTRGANIMSLRPFSIYGPGQPAHMFLAELMEACVRRETFRMSEGTQRRDFVHVDDVCEALVQALLTESSKAWVFNVGTGTGRSLRKVAETVVEVTSAPIHIDRTRPSRSHDPAELVADTRRASDKLGWTARIGFEEGIRRLWEEVAARAD